MTTPSDLQLLGFQWAVALSLFLGLNWLGRKSDMFGYETLTMFTEREEAMTFNFLFRAVTPVVLLILVASACYTVGLDGFTKNLHFAVIYYIAFRIGFNLIRGRRLLLPWTRLVVQWAVTMGLSLLAYTHLITRKEYLFPDLKTVGNEVWLAIGGYLYVLANQVFSDYGGAERRSLNYVRSRRGAFERRFGRVISSKSANIKWHALILAILIVEDFNRPVVARHLERVLFRIGLARTLGIMQVRADRPITDDESVALGIEHLLDCYRTASATRGWRLDHVGWAEEIRRQQEEAQLIHQTLVLYNPSGDYARDVASIFEKLMEDSVSNEQVSIHPDEQGQTDASSEMKAEEPEA